MNMSSHLKVNYEINSTLIVSTSHIQQATIDGLEDVDYRLNWTADLVIYKKSNYGWFIVIPYDSEIPISVPEDLRALMQIAKSHKCYYLELDQDGPRYDNLPYYEEEE